MLAHLYALRMPMSGKEEDQAVVGLQEWAQLVLDQGCDGFLGGIGIEQGRNRLQEVQLFDKEFAHARASLTALPNFGPVHIIDPNHCNDVPTTIDYRHVAGAGVK